ncbi:hypothetical protein GS483_00240 [Rhodococcus hoagii]|nr:hypothetical protein [Prescottella equi]
MSAGTEVVGADGTNPGGATPPASTGQPSESPLGEAGLRALQAEREARAEAERKAADLKRQLDEINAEKLTELEKAQQAAAAAQQSAQEIASSKDTVDAENLRLRFAINNGVPAAWINRLHGATDEELAADWESLKPTLAPPSDPSAPRVPAPLPHAGPQGGPPQTEDDLLYEQIYGSRK